MISVLHAKKRESDRDTKKSFFDYMFRHAHKQGALATKPWFFITHVRTYTHCCSAFVTVQRALKRAMEADVESKTLCDSEEEYWSSCSDEEDTAVNKTTSKVSHSTTLPPQQSKEAVDTSEDGDRLASNNTEPTAVDFSRMESERVDTQVSERKLNNHVTLTALDHYTDVPGAALPERRVNFDTVPARGTSSHVEARTYRKEKQKLLTALAVLFFLLTCSLLVVYILAIHSQTKTTELQNTVSTIQSQRATNNSLSHIQQRLDQLEEDLDTSLTVMRSLLSLVNSLSQGSDVGQPNNLQSSLDNLTSAQTDTTVQLNSLQSLVSNLSSDQALATAQLSSLQSSVATLTTAQSDTDTQVTSLQSSVSTLTTQQASTTTQVTSLQSSVTTLTTRINSAINLYQGCIEDTYSCSTGANGATDRFWDYCVTEWVDPTTAVSASIAGRLSRGSRLNKFMTKLKHESFSFPKHTKHYYIVFQWGLFRVLNICTYTI